VWVLKISANIVPLIVTAVLALLKFSKMALSFASGTMTLTSWDFGAGDIAVLAGAGRAIATWLMSQRRDRALLEFLAV